MTQLATRLGRPLAPGTPVHRTPNGGCTDPLNGKYAPKDGVTYCERWLHCFKCPHQCITGEEDDLWRLYSFYWALQRNGQRIRRLPIGGLFRFVIKAMETIVMDRFGERARIAMARARQQPHPFWALAIEGSWLHV
jgi:hypothetical protein